MHKMEIAGMVFAYDSKHVHTYIHAHTVQKVTLVKELQFLDLLSVYCIY